MNIKDPTPGQTEKTERTWLACPVHQRRRRRKVRAQLEDAVIEAMRAGRFELTRGDNPTILHDGDWDSDPIGQPDSIQAQRFHNPWNGVGADARNCR